MLDERIPVVALDGHRYAVEVHDEPTANAIVLVLPAMGVTSTYYGALIENLRESGVAVAIADCRGHGQSDVRARRGVDWGYRELVEVDLPATIDAVRQRLPDRPIYALGHSLGGQVACLHAAAYPGELAGVALVASCSVHFVGWGFPRGIATLLATQLIAMTSRLSGYFPGERLRFAGKEGRRQMIDWAHNARTGRWTIRGSSHDYEQLLTKVDIPVLAMSFAGDTYAPRAAVDNQVAKLSSAALTRHHWTAADFDRGGLHHFRWVRHSAPIAGMVKDWIG